MIYILAACTRNNLKSWVARTEKGKMMTEYVKEKTYFLKTSSVICIVKKDDTRNVEVKGNIMKKKRKKEWKEGKYHFRECNGNGVLAITLHRGNYPCFPGPGIKEVWVRTRIMTLATQGQGEKVPALQFHGVLAGAAVARSVTSDIHFAGLHDVSEISPLLLPLREKEIHW